MGKEIKYLAILSVILQSCTPNSQKFVGYYELKHSIAPHHVFLNIEASGDFLCQHYSDVLGDIKQTGKWIKDYDTLSFTINNTVPPSMRLTTHGSSHSSCSIKLVDTLGTIFGASVYVNGESRALVSNIDGEVFADVPISEIKVEYLGNVYKTLVESQYSQKFEIFILSYKSVTSFQLPTKWQVSGRLLVPFNANNEAVRDAAFIRRKKNPR